LGQDGLRDEVEDALDIQAGPNRREAMLGDTQSQNSDGKCVTDEIEINSLE